MKIIEADALDTLRAMEPGAAQVLLTDPPYCSGGWSEAARAQSKSMTVAGEKDGWFKADAMSSNGLAFLLRSIMCLATPDSSGPPPRAVV